jgi:hypothetical protein
VWRVEDLLPDHDELEKAQEAQAGLGAIAAQNAMVSEQLAP